MRSGNWDPFEKLGLARLAWQIKIYIYLLMFFSAVLFLAVVANLPGAVPALATEVIKMVVAALLGALSLHRT